VAALPAIEARAAEQYRAVAQQMVMPLDPSPTMAAARDELARGLKGLLAREVPATSRIERNAALVLGTPRNAPLVARMRLDLSPLGPEGYRIRSTSVNARSVTVIAANSDIGVLYGTFAFLRLLQTRQPLTDLNLTSCRA